MTYNLSLGYMQLHNSVFILGLMLKIKTEILISCKENLVTH